MEYQSLSQYEGKKVRLILKNGFWYRCKILKVSSDCVSIIEEQGRSLSIEPDFISFVEVLR
jgi:hypothetical protein